MPAPFANLWRQVPRSYAHVLNTLRHLLIFSILLHVHVAVKLLIGQKLYTN